MLPYRYDASIWGKKWWKSGKHVVETQNDETIATAKALEEATLRESDEKILHLHEVRQLELTAQSKELSKITHRSRRSSAFSRSHDSKLK